MTGTRRLSAAAALTILGWAGAAFAIVPGQTTEQAATSTGAAAQQGQAPAGTSGGTEVTGIVTQADKQAGWIIVDGQTYVLSQKGGGDVGLPAAGEKVTLSYQERDGQKVITQLGQAKQ
jgi:hypothetical protein